MGARAEVKATARTLASRLAALAARKFSMFSSARLNACDSRTAAMVSCKLAFTEPISTRVLRKALRAWSENHRVAISINGVTSMLSKAKGRLRVSML